VNVEEIEDFSFIGTTERKRHCKNNDIFLSLLEVVLLLLVARITDQNKGKVILSYERLKSMLLDHVQCKTMLFGHSG
jgi:hypothetical protein